MLVAVLRVVEPQWAQATFLPLSLHLTVPPHTHAAELRGSWRNPESVRTGFINWIGKSKRLGEKLKKEVSGQWKMGRGAGWWSHRSCED